VRICNCLCQNCLSMASREHWCILIHKLHASKLLKMKTVLWDFNAGVGEESYLYPTCGGHSLHNKTNDNGKQMVNFELGRDLVVT